MATKTIKKTKEVQATKGGKTLDGIVTSDKMTNTVVVKVDHFVKHPKYGKFITRSKKYKAHDEGNTKKIGDKVTIKECSPISKDKHFTVVNA